MKKQVDASSYTISQDTTALTPLSAYDALTAAPVEGASA